MDAVIKYIVANPLVAVGIFTALLSSVVIIFREDIRDFFRRRIFKIEKDFLVANWRCKWEIETPNDYEPRVITDQIRILTLRKGIFDGESLNSWGHPYEIKGFATPLSVSFSFRGKGDAKDFVGVVLIQREGTSAKTMEGQWSQFYKEKKFYEGKIEMVKDK
jgi:hypothetical protein